VVLRLLFKVGLAKLQAVKTCRAGCEKRPLASRSNQQIPGGKLPRSLRVHYMGAAGSATVPVVQFHKIDSQTPENCKDADVIIVGGAMEATAGIVVHIHIKTLLDRYYK
jgi:hypothetical protein